MRVAIGAFLVLSSTSAAFAQTSEAEQRQACMGDVMKFCLSQVPDRQRIGTCLLANRVQLAPECRQVVDNARENRPARR